MRVTLFVIVTLFGTALKINKEELKLLSRILYTFIITEIAKSWRNREAILVCEDVGKSKTFVMRQITSCENCRRHKRICFAFLQCCPGQKIHA